MNHSPRRRAAVAAALGFGLALAAGRRVGRVVVEGPSMSPVLEPGDRLLVWRGAPLRPGDLVALTDPRAPGRLMVKRLAATPGGTAHQPDGTAIPAGTGYIVLGDNRNLSTDSRHFGPINRKSIQGRCLYRYGPETRRGWLGNPGNPLRVGNQRWFRALRQIDAGFCLLTLPRAKPRC